MKSNTGDLCCAITSSDEFSTRGYKTESVKGKTDNKCASSGKMSEISSSEYRVVSDDGKSMLKMIEFSNEVYPNLSLNNVELHAERSIVNRGKKALHTAKDKLRNIRKHQRNDKDHHDRQSTVHPPQQKPSICFAHSDIDRVLQCDTFTNDVLQHMIITDAIKSGDMEHCVSKVEDITLCNPTSEGYVDDSDHVDHYGIVKYTYEKDMPVDSVSSLNGDDIEGSTLPLLFLLDKLYTGYGFVHSSIDSTALTMVKVKTSGQYKRAKWNGNYILRLNNFEHASSTIESNEAKIRVFSPSNFNSQLAPFHPRTSQVETSEDGKTFSVTTYSFNNINDVLNISTDSGLPYYRSFDAYCLLITLHHYSWFHQTVMNSARLKIIFWDVLWLSDKDKAEADSRLTSSRSSVKHPRMTDILAIMKGLRLRCDLVPYITISVKGSPLKST
jgi:hypothetical protein